MLGAHEEPRPKGRGIKYLGRHTAHLRSPRWGTPQAVGNLLAMINLVMKFSWKWLAALLAAVAPEIYTGGQTKFPGKVNCQINSCLRI